MSADKYPCIFSRQMETIVYIFIAVIHSECAVFVAVMFTINAGCKICTV